MDHIGVLECVIAGMMQERKSPSKSVDTRHKRLIADLRPQTSDLLLLDVGADLLVRGGLLETARNVDNGHHSGELAACP
jgi:hypothetical protein